MTAIAIFTDAIQLLPALSLSWELGQNVELATFSTQGLVIMAEIPNVDILSNMQTGWTDFIQSGKAGASVIGLVVGYMIRGITK
jgi:hypothetical protein